MPRAVPEGQCCFACDLCTLRIFGGDGGGVTVYGKTGTFGRVGDKSMLKMYKKAGVGREGDI